MIELEEQLNIRKVIELTWSDIPFNDLMMSSLSSLGMG